MINKCKVLMELRACFDGFAGIPQDNRITYKLLSELSSLDLHGHLLDRGVSAAGFRWKQVSSASDELIAMSRYIGQLQEGASLSGKLSSLLGMARFAELIKLFAFNWLNRCQQERQKLFPVDARFYQDYLWRALFDKTLRVEDMEAIVSRQFWGSSVGWAQMNSALIYPFPQSKINTDAWDIYISQTPFPAKLSPNTKLVVRFHDAMPIQMPHTINHPLRHQRFFSAALKENSQHAYFVCNSESTRDRLLTIFPEVESRSYVVPCCVTDDFYVDQSIPAKDILIKRAVEFVKAKAPALDGGSDPDPNPHSSSYFLAVGTMEPRKNYVTLLDAWDQYLHKVEAPLDLVLVANTGWGSEEVVDRIEKIQRNMKKHGPRLHVLQGVPLNELRCLYSQAHRVVVPSYNEGFSFSGIEAMRCGTGVIASGIATHKEIYGSVPDYFNPYDLEGLVSQLVLNSTLEKGASDSASLITHTRQYDADSIREKWSETLSAIHHSK